MSFGLSLAGYPVLISFVPDAAYMAELEGFAAIDILPVARAWICLWCGAMTSFCAEVATFVLCKKLLLASEYPHRIIGRSSKAGLQARHVQLIVNLRI